MAYRRKFTSFKSKRASRGRRSYSRKRTGSSKVRRTTGDVARLARKVLELERGQKQQHVLRGFPDGTPFFIGARGSPQCGQRYFTVPVSLAIPPQDPKIPPYSSDAYRRKCEVMLVGVKVEFVVSHVLGFKVTLVCHEAVVPDAICPVQVDARGVPTLFRIGVKDDKADRLRTLQETGFTLGKDGPYQVVVERGPADTEGRVPTSYSLKAPDGNIFECPTNPGKGGPLGKIDWHIGRGKKTLGCKTVNGVVETPPQMSEGIFAKERVSAYFDLNRQLQFSLEEGNTLVGSLPIQITGYVEPLAGAPLAKEEDFMLAGGLENMMVTVYYRS